MALVLSGDLTRVSLASVLQLLDTECSTGRLELPPLGRMLLREGQPVEVHLGPLRGPDAFNSLFLAPSQTFELHDEPVEGGRPLGQMTPLVLGALRISDEWSRLAAMVLRPAPGATPKGLGAVIPHLDGHATLAEAVALGGAAPAQVVDPLLDALEARQLVQAGRPDPERARAAALPPSPEDFYALIDQGRVELRAGRLAQAEAAFRRALMARPGERLAEQNLRRVIQLRQAQTT